MAITSGTRGTAGGVAEAAVVTRGAAVRMIAFLSVLLGIF